MRTAIRVLVAVIALVAELRAPMAAGATAPVIVHPNWRLVARGDLPYAVADDRYVVIAPGNGARLLTLIDEQSGRVKTLAPPNCSINSPADQLQLGGPWLMVGCGVLATLGFDYLLYDISSGQWRSFAISARCPGFCRVAGIGRHWAKILSNDEVMAYSPDIAYLQDIDTGRFIRDPVTPGGRIYDDLNAPSGSASLCSPLRYPTFYPSHTGPEPGLLAFYGKFVLVSDQRLVKTSLGPVPGPVVTTLRRCGSRLTVTIPSTSGPMLASSGAVIRADDRGTLDGWRLPGLQRFILGPPAGTQTGPCGGSAMTVTPLAVTAHSVYVRNTCGPQRVWAASLPSAQALTRCVVPNLTRKALASAQAAIRAAHCRVGRITHAYSNQIAAGRVLAQKPAPGTVTKTGSTIRLVLSRRKPRGTAHRSAR